MHFLSRIPTIALFLLLGCAPKATLPPVAGPSPAPAAVPVPLTLDYDQLLLAAQSYLDVSRPVDAAAVAADATRMEPKRPDAYIVWGRALAQSDALGESAQHYEQARALGSRDPTLFAELASVYDVSKHYAEAIAVYRDYLTDHPSDAAMRDELALTLLLLNKADDAVAELKTALQNAPANPQIQQDLGYAQLHAGAFAEARDTLTPVVEKDPKRVDAMRFLAQAYIGLKDKPRARAWLSKVLQAFPRDRAAQFMLEHLGN